MFWISLLKITKQIQYKLIQGVSQKEHTHTLHKTLTQLFYMAKETTNLFVHDPVIEKEE